MAANADPEHSSWHVGYLQAVDMIQEVEGHGGDFRGMAFAIAFGQSCHIKEMSKDYALI